MQWLRHSPGPELSFGVRIFIDYRQQENEKWRSAMQFNGAVFVIVYNEKGLQLYSINAGNDPNEGLKSYILQLDDD
jgi:hypothetical protein